MTIFFSSINMLNASIGIIIIANFCLLATERQRQRIRILALQGMIMGLMPLLAHSSTNFNGHLIFITLVFLTIKGGILPLLLFKTYNRLSHLQSPTPYLGYSGCLFAGVCGLALSLWVNSKLGIAANPLFSLFFPVAFTTIVSGLLLIVTRKNALTQVLGYLTMENGIFLLGVPMVQADAIWLEVSILLDILVGVFVMIVAIRHLHEEFSSINVDQIASLRD